MNNLNKRILISLLLTVSPVCVMANDKIDSLDVTRLTNTIVLPSDETNIFPAKINKKRSSSHESSGSSKKSTAEMSLCVGMGSFTEQVFLLDTIREAVTKKKFNIKKGTENCLRCSLHFIEYIRSEGAECKSADRLPATEENILILSRGHAELLSPEDNEKFGVPVINMLDENDSTVIDLTNPKLVFSRIKFDELHEYLLKESQNTDSFTVAMLFLEYSNGQKKTV